MGGETSVPVETRTIQQAYVYALDATPRQCRAFASHCGGARFAYNWGLAQTTAALDARQAQKDAGVEPDVKVPSHFDLCKMWTAHKDDPEAGLHWVGENFVGTYQAALRDASVAWKNFFSSRSGKRAGRRMGRPRFKSKHRSRKAFQVHGSTLQVVDAHHVKFPKIGVVKTHESTRKLLRRYAKGTARLVRATISQHSNGRWYASLTVELEREIRTGPSARQRAGGAIGIDIGVRDVVTLSTGAAYEAPRMLQRSLDRLAQAQKALARKEKGSGKRRRTLARVGKIHHHIAEQRNRFTHRLSSSLIHNAASIAVEGWNVTDTAQRGDPDVPKHIRRRRNRALYDAGLGQLRWQLESKSKWYGSVVTVTDPHLETGRTCSVCGTVRDKPLPLDDEEFRGQCGHVVADRRMNTAFVLEKIARKAMNGAPTSEEPLNARREDVRPATPRRDGQPSVKREARTRRQRRAQPGTPDP